MNFLKFFTIGTEKEHAGLGLLCAELENILGEMNEEQAKRLTGVAGLLGKVAYCDREISNEEQAKIVEILSTSMALSDQESAMIVNILARLTVELVGQQDYKYTRMLNDVLNKQQKSDVIRLLLEVAVANESISDVEDSTIRIIAEGLLFTPREYFDLRAPFREHLELLKSLPGKKG